MFPDTLSGNMVVLEPARNRQHWSQSGILHHFLTACLWSQWDGRDWLQATGKKIKNKTLQQNYEVLYQWKKQYHTCTHIDGILLEGPYLPCVSMAGRALLAGYHRHKLYRCKIVSKGHKISINHRAGSRFAPSQWETSLLCNDISYWLGTSLESALNHENVVHRSIWYFIYHSSPYVRKWYNFG